METAEAPEKLFVNANVVNTSIVTTNNTFRALEVMHEEIGSSEEGDMLKSCENS